MAPWKCLDCGTWWSGLEHRCPPTSTSTGPSQHYIPPQPYIPQTSGFTVRCTCPLNRGDNYSGYCPIHDVQVACS